MWLEHWSESMGWIVFGARGTLSGATALFAEERTTSRMQLKLPFEDVTKSFRRLARAPKVTSSSSSNTFESACRQIRTTRGKCIDRHIHSRRSGRSALVHPKTQDAWESRAHDRCRNRPATRVHRLPTDIPTHLMDKSAPALPTNCRKVSCELTLGDGNPRQTRQSVPHSASGPIDRRPPGRMASRLCRSVRLQPLVERPGGAALPGLGLSGYRRTAAACSRQAPGARNGFWQMLRPRLCVVGLTNPTRQRGECPRNPRWRVGLIWPAHRVQDSGAAKDVAGAKICCAPPSAPPTRLVRPSHFW